MGLLPKRTIKNLEKTIYQEGGEELIRSWNNANWINMPQTLGDKIAPLLGANPGEVIVVDSTSVNLFKVFIICVNFKQKPKSNRE